uniref:Uncharacterized protein n=1 Tax=Anopheles dirus TaxID=7168 RepID=A0A182NYN6_9DIPT
PTRGRSRKSAARPFRPPNLDRNWSLDLGQLSGDTFGCGLCRARAECVIAGEERRSFRNSRWSLQASFRVLFRSA